MINMKITIPRDAACPLCNCPVSERNLVWYRNVAFCAACRWAIDSFILITAAHVVIQHVNPHDLSDCQGLIAYTPSSKRSTPIMHDAAKLCRCIDRPNARVDSLPTERQTAPRLTH